MTSGAEDWAYIYTADDERIWSYDLGEEHLALDDARPRRQSAAGLPEQLTGTWSVGDDYIYRDGLLLAAENPDRPAPLPPRPPGHAAPDHPRRGDKVAYHVYYPFGEEATAYNQDTERMKFTGHERDLAAQRERGMTWTTCMRGMRVR